MSIPLLRWERNPEVAESPQEKAGLTLKLEHIPGSRASIRKDPDFPSTPDMPDSPAMPRLELQVSTQNTKGGDTAPGHLEIKPQIPRPTREEA